MAIKAHINMCSMSYISKNRGASHLIYKWWEPGPEHLKDNLFSWEIQDRHKEITSLKCLFNYSQRIEWKITSWQKRWWKTFKVCEKRFIWFSAALHWNLFDKQQWNTDNDVPAKEKDTCNMMGRTEWGGCIDVKVREELLWSRCWYKAALSALWPAAGDAESWHVNLQEQAEERSYKRGRMEQFVILPIRLLGIGENIREERLLLFICYVATGPLKQLVCVPAECLTYCHFSKVTFFLKVGINAADFNPYNTTYNELTTSLLSYCCSRN